MKKEILNLIGLILLSTCLHGQMKHLKMPDPTEGMVDVNIIDQNTFIVAESWANKIYTTKDNGESWTFKTVNTIYPGSNEAISFINENIGYVQTTELVNGGVFEGGTQVSNLYKTTDGGTSWSIITPGGLDPETTNFDMGAMFFFTENIGMANINGTFWRTMDGGDSWLAIGDYPNSVNHDSKAKGVAYFTKKYHRSEDAQIFYTNNYGETWQEIIVPNVESNSSQSKITIVDNIAYISFNNRLVIIEDGIIKDEHELSINPFLFIGGEKQTMIETTLTSANPPEIKINQWTTLDFGANSTLEDVVDDGFVYLIKSDYDFNKGVMVGTQGDIVIFETLTSPNAIGNQNRASDLKIYPNPISKGQSIYIEGEGIEGSSWKVSDTLGKTIDQGVVESNILNITNLDVSGIYYLEINFNSKVITKKFIVQ